MKKSRKRNWLYSILRNSKAERNVNCNNLMEEISLEFLENIFPGVKSFKCELVQQEQEAGTSKCYFLELNYDEEDKNKPTKLFAKLQLPNSADKEQQMNIFEREALHYHLLLNPDKFEELKACILRPNPFYVPKLFYSSILPSDPKRRLFLFEDLREGKWECGNQLHGCDKETAKLILSSIASVHARWWNKPIEKLEKEYPILSNLDYITTPMATSLYFEAAYPSFLENFKEELKTIDDVDTKFQLMGEAIVPILEYFTDRNGRPKTIVHGDLRLDNLLFRENENEEREIAIIDWQLGQIGHCARDLAKFLILNVNCNVEEQKELIRFYCSKLKEEKGEGAGDDVDEDLILKDFHQMSYLIIVSAVLAWSTVCVGSLPPSLDYIVNIDRLKALFRSWIDRILIYIKQINFFEVAEKLALDVRAYDQYLSSKYDDQEELPSNEEQKYSKIVIALKPWEDCAPWPFIHSQIILFKCDGLIKWEDLNNGDPVIGIGEFGVPIGKFSAVVDNSLFSLENLIYSLEEIFEDFIQRVELISSDDLKDDPSSFL